jgi:two-component sensor histidine kinase
MAAADYLFVPPRYTFRPENFAQGLSVVVTALALLVVLWLAARYRNTTLSRAHERRDAEEHLRLLVREIDHRANNLLAVMQGMVKLAKADSVEALKRDLLGRIGALARAHQLIASTQWRGANLETLVEEALQPYALGESGRVHAEGPSMTLSPAEAEGVAMAIYELATNAAKYGAFSAPTGRVKVTWGRDSSGARHMRWQEDGGPPVVKPDRQGLGTRLVERALAASGGRTQLLWRPEGVVCDFDLPPQSRQEPRSFTDEQIEAAPAGGLTPEPP